MESRSVLRLLVSDAVIYGGLRALTFLGQLLVLPLYTRQFSQVEYGALELLWSLGTVACLLASLQVESGLGRTFFEREGAERDSAVLTAALVPLTFGTVIAAVLTAFAQPIATELLAEPALAPAVITAAWAVPLTQLAAVLQVALRLHRARARFCVSLGLQVLLTVGGAFVLVLILGRGIGAVFEAQLAGAAVGALVAATPLWRARARFDRATLRAMLYYGLPLVPATVGQWAQAYLDRMLMAGMLGLDDVAIYALGMRITSAVLLLEQGFTLAWMPHVMKGMDDDGFARTQARVFTLFTLALLLAAGAVVTFTPELLAVFAPASYAAAASVLGLLAAGRVLRALIGVAGVGISRARRTWMSSVAYFAGLVVGIVAFFALAPHYGIVGAAIAFVASAVTSFGLLYAFSQRLWPIAYPRATLFAAGGAYVVLTVCLELAPSLPARASALAAYTLVLVALAFRRG